MGIWGGRWGSAEGCQQRGCLNTVLKDELELMRLRWVAWTKGTRWAEGPYSREGLRQPGWLRLCEVRCDWSWTPGLEGARVPRGLPGVESWPGSWGPAQAEKLFLTIEFGTFQSIPDMWFLSTVLTVHFHLRVNTVLVLFLLFIYRPGHLPDSHLRPRKEGQGSSANLGRWVAFC